MTSLLKSTAILNQRSRGATDPLCEVVIPPHGLPGILRLPHRPYGLIVFAHGSGSSRLSPRDNAVAESFAGRSLATLLFDLLEPVEEDDRANVFNIGLLADRLTEAIAWIATQRELASLPLGLFGASTGAAAALVAAARLDRRVAAVVSRGGRPDLAGEALAKVMAPTLLIVGAADYGVIELNQQALARVSAPKMLRLVPGATHLFSEPGALQAVVEAAAAWFGEHLHAPPRERPLVM